MRAAMHDYFAGERRGGVWLMGAGAPALLLGAGLSVPQDPASRGWAFAQGLGYSLVALGALDVLAGLTFYRNSRRRVPAFERQLASAPAAYRDGELARMRRVNREMRLLEAIEIPLILAGGAMASIGALQGRDLLAGIGAGLAVETAVLLIYDQLAARRALRYTESLLRFRPALSAAPGAGLLAVRGAF